MTDPWKPRCYRQIDKRAKGWKAKSLPCYKDAEFTIATRFDANNHTFVDSCAEHLAEQFERIIKQDLASSHYRSGVTRWTVNPGYWMTDHNGSS